MIAIKDMEMPSDCYDCPFAKNKRTNDYGSFCECGILEDYETINLYEHSKHPNCPLVEIEERKVGKWIYDKTSQNWRCSKCNETPKTLGYVGTSDFMEKEFTFCNHCGAEMVC